MFGRAILPSHSATCSKADRARRRLKRSVAAEYRLAVRFALRRLGKASAPRRASRDARPRRSQHRHTSARASRDGPPREPDDEPPLVILPRRVPADRLVPLIREQLDRGRTVRDLARLAGVPERRFRSILQGDQAKVAFSTADRLVTYALGGPTVWLDQLSDVYGEGT